MKKPKIEQPATNTLLLWFYFMMMGFGLYMIRIGSKLTEKIEFLQTIFMGAGIILYINKKMWKQLKIFTKYIDKGIKYTKWKKKNTTTN